MLHLYRRLLAARRRSPALRAGDFSWLASPEGVLAFERRRGDDRRVVLVNFRAEPVRIGTVPAEELEVEVASDGAGEGLAFSGVLGPDQAVVLAPEAAETLGGDRA